VITIHSITRGLTEFTHYTTGIWETFWNTQAKRDARAAEAKEAARTFVKLLANAIPAEALLSVYIHFLTCHIEEQVREFGPLWFWSGEGLEHKNFIWKKTGRGTSQRGLAPHQNGGQKPRDGGAQQRTAPGREGQTLVQVIAGEMFGGVQREGRVVKPRHALPASIL
jgi:hypothetical protein